MRISLEGNIGAGKSSILQSLAETFGDAVSIYTEPIHEWGDLLQMYYADRQTWCLPLSLKILLGFTASNGAPTPVSIVERSPLTCKTVFTKMLHQDGTMNTCQWNVFNDYWNVLGWSPDVIIYVDTSEDACMKRIRSRARDGEETIECQDLRRFRFHYELMLKEFQGPVIRIDGDAPLEDVVAEVTSRVKEYV